MNLQTVISIAAVVVSLLVLAMNYVSLRHKAKETEIERLDKRIDEQEKEITELKDLLKTCERRRAELVEENVALLTRLARGD